MPVRPLVRAAARNNAEWCDTFCRTHGVAGRFRTRLWSSPARTPPYFPDAVTLVPDVTVEEVLAGVDTGEGCSIKDSFSSLDLNRAGFRPLFRSEWVVRERSDPLPGPGRSWSALSTDEHLGAWESVLAEPPERSGFFRRALLEDETVAVLAGHDGERIVAGAVATRSATVIGLSNLFATDGDLASAWGAAATAATARWGAMPVVGYDSGASLDAAHAAGFESIGELVVWLNAPVASPGRGR